MEFFETLHIHEQKKIWVKNCQHYVDDTFVAIKNKEQADKMHQTIKLTMEKEKKKSINLMDVEITKKY